MEKLGLRVGLEIHQQLASDTKLFCRCPIIKSEELPNEIKRKLRPVPGETGDFDRAVMYEHMRNKSFVYKYNTESSCLVELDDDPPKKINEKALQTAIQICKMLKMNLVDELHFMRKTVVDGSTVSGFQRTALLGLDGHIEIGRKKISIINVSVEEDSATSISKNGDVTEYRIDRLGVPLVEIGTGPDIHSPEEAKEVAERIGMILRSVEVVRGIGSIRQDVNVSIERGARVEIKGFQELEKMPELVKNEIERQLCLLEIKEHLHKKGIKEIKPEIKNVTGIFTSTRNNFIRKILEKKGRVVASKLPFAGMMKKQCGDRTFGKELSGYAFAFGYGIMHSEEDLEKNELTEEFSKLKDIFNANKDEIVLIVTGYEPENAMKAVIERAAECLNGVPEETRIADGTGSRYARPLPGSSRLYPESDIPCVRFDKKYIDSIKMPKTLFEKEEELLRILPKEMVSQLISSYYFSLFEELSKINIDKKIIANTLLSIMTDLRRREFDVEKITKTDLEILFDSIKKKIISKDSISNILELVCAGATINKAIENYRMLSDEELKTIIISAKNENPEKNESALMGIIMSRVKGKASGQKIIEILKELK